MAARLLALAVLLGLPPVLVWAVVATTGTTGAALAGETPGATRPVVVSASLPAPAPGLMPAPPAPRVRATRQRATVPAPRTVAPARAEVSARTSAAARAASPARPPAQPPLAPAPAARPMVAPSRDPFVSLLAGKFSGEENTPVFDIGELRLVGVLWGQTDRFALVENSHGSGTALRVGDRLVNGYVESISPTSLTLVQTAPRGPRRLVLHMKECQNDAATQ